MHAHIHATLMAEYAKDALETDKPWERWEAFTPGGGTVLLLTHPCWDASVIYRRKRIPLCQVEGKDVFPGDKLWWKVNQEWIEATGYQSEDDTIFWSQDSGRRHFRRHNLSWTEPPKTKTVYQWAQEGNFWYVSPYFYETEEEFRKQRGLTDTNRVRRLDHTALEVPV